MVLEKIPSVEEVLIFSGSTGTQCGFHQQNYNFPCRIPNINALEAVCRRNDLLSHLMDHPGDWTPVVMDWLLHLVTRGLGKRVELLCCKPQTPLQVK